MPSWLSPGAPAPTGRALRPPARTTLSSGPGGSPGASAEQTTGQKLTQQLLEREEAPAPVATVRGPLAVPSGSASVEVDVLAVRASAETTLLRWRLRSATGQTQQVFTSSLARPNVFDTRAVALVDAAGNQRLEPFTYIPQLKTDDLRCACSPIPKSVSAAGVQMYALFPPLAANATTVDVVIPGLPTAEKVAVTR